jgi:hypothetical protein
MLMDRMCSYNEFKQSPTMAVNSNSTQFAHHSGNWFGASSGYYPNAAHHSYYHSSSIQPHQMLSIMQENVQSNTDPNLMSWSPHHTNYQHQTTNLEWLGSLAANSQSQISEYSTEGSDISPSPTSNRTLSPSYRKSPYGSVSPSYRKSPYGWMKKTCFHSDPSAGKW